MSKKINFGFFVWQLSVMAVVQDGSCPVWQLSRMAVVQDGSCPVWQLSGMAVVQYGSCPYGSRPYGSCPYTFRQILCESIGRTPVIHPDQSFLNKNISRWRSPSDRRRVVSSANNILVNSGHSGQIVDVS